MRGHAMENAVHKEYSSKKPPFISRYIALTRAGIMEGLAYQTSMITNVVANLIYLVIIYFLWKAIYASSPTDVVNGMTFYDTMVYLVLASAMFNFMDQFVVWNIGEDYQTGHIVNCMTKPIDYQAYMFWALSGNVVTSFIITFVPTFIIVSIVAHGTLHFGLNLLFFFVSLILGTVLNFMVDYCVGLICFYTQSIWGVNTMKEVVVALLSGATIPLAFFPETFRNIVLYLPFQAIYNLPLQILTNKTMGLADYALSFGKQLFWIVFMILLTRIFWVISKRKLTVNGG